MSTRDLIDAIHAGEATAIQTAFEDAMASRIAERLDTMRQSVAQNMFKTEQAVATEVVEEEVELDEAADKDVHPDHIHVSKAENNKYKVHAVGKNFAHGIKVGEHLSDTELDDAGEMGAHIKMKKPAK